MFTSGIYKQRQVQLQELLTSSGQTGLVLFPASVEAPFTATENPYAFRQNSSFLYYFGLKLTDLVGVLDLSTGKRFLAGNDQSIDDIIWSGRQTSLQELASLCGECEVLSLSGLKKMLKPSPNRPPLHFLPNCRAEDRLYLSELTGLTMHDVQDEFSQSLIDATVKLRSIKGDEEIVEMEKALDISSKMYGLMFNSVAAGLSEELLYFRIQSLLASKGAFPSFPPIMTVRGDILHNRTQPNTLKDGDLFLMDSGAESPLHYASDITRTFPVGGKFSTMQAEVYSVVLSAQKAAIEMIRPAVSYKDVHLHAVRIICSGLKDLGLMKGDVNEAVASGAHALFMPHGLGHMLGLDVHDMEEYGEDNVGYDQHCVRSDQFGLRSLRLARKLEAGFVLTVEPGVYFINGLIDKWKAEGHNQDFICYDVLDKYRGFGGIRIEDDILVTEKNARVLGKSIPKDIAEIESVMI